SCLKHFPGHGSTMDDSHHDFVDATESWNEKEIKPYQYFIDNNMVDAILTAHILIQDFDESHPATLSRSIITDLLRRRMGYDGVVISDDLNMGAIRLNYNYEDAVELAINAGVDIILNSNVMQYNANIAKITFQTIKNLVEKGRISKARIDESFSRIMKLKRNLS
ncbi:MAG: glycoside hydrolase family 3, partial [Candidatus Marinimicrobia bacterium]|nr:glycoside hydrolase family 3 [Candidatus Neomarinimicrobiota bacterium]